MNRGYVKLWRKSMDSQVWQNPELWQLWCYCLIRANYKDTWMPVKTGKGFTQVQVKRGQFIFGRNQVAKELRQKPRSIYDRMLKLEKCQNITIQTNTHYSIVTICNYDLYQPQNESEATTNTTTNQQPTNTENKLKKVKKKKREAKISRSRFLDAVYLSDEEYSKLINELGEEKTKYYIQRLDDYMATSGRKYKNHCRLILKWYREDMEKQKQEVKDDNDGFY